MAAVRAEFATGLGARIETLRAALHRLEGGFRSDDAQALYRAAHSLHSATCIITGIESPGCV